MLLEYLQPFLGLLASHPYLFIFVGMLIAGEVVLLPAIYLAATGRLDPPSVVAVSIAATLVSDIVWYWLGRRFPAKALERIPGHRTSKLVAGIERLFTTKGPHVLFLSKFVYGTRVAAQVLSGVHDMPVRTYLVWNTAGVLALTAALVAIAYSVAGTARRFADVVEDMEIAFVAFVAIAVLGYLVVGRMMKRKWSQ